MEPSNRLIESLLLRPSLMIVGQVSPDCKSMYNATEEINLPRLARFDEDSFGLIA